MSQATQISMVLAGAQPSNTHMTANRLWPRPWAHMWTLVVSWGTDINTDPGYDRTMALALASYHHGARCQHRPPSSACPYGSINPQDTNMW